MKKPFRKISVLIVLFSLFGIQNAASQGYVKLNALYALVGVVNPSVEFAISPKSDVYKRQRLLRADSAMKARFRRYVHDSPLIRLEGFDPDTTPYPVSYTQLNASWWTNCWSANLSG